MSFRPTDRGVGVISGPFFGCVQKIRGNITGYRHRFGSAREEELIPALAVISRSSAAPRRVSVMISLFLSSKVSDKCSADFPALSIVDFKHVLIDNT